MKINGSLERAHIENTSGQPGGSQPTGRIVADITAPAAAIPYFYNGTTWKQLQFQATAQTIISQNSGKACTVDWSTGLFQKVVLTDNCIISFSNPQTGYQHNLIVTQNAPTGLGSGVCYVYKFNMIDQDCQHLPYQPNYLELGESRYHIWQYAASVRAAYATIPKVTFGAGGIPGNAHLGSNFSFDGTRFGMSSGTTPFHDYVQIWDVNVQHQTPIGQLNFLTPSTVAGASTGLVYSPDGRAVYISSGTSPFLHGYSNNSTSSGIGTVFTAPVTAPAGACKCIAMHPNGTYVGVGHTTTPFMSLYPLNAAGLLGNIGTKMTDPVTLPAAQVNAIEWAPTGDFLAVGSGTTPFIQVWPFTESIASGVLTGAIGAVCANPGTLPNGGPSAGLGKGIAWRPQGDYIAMASSSATDHFLYLVPFNRSTATFGTPIVTTSAAIAAASNTVRWTPDGQYLIVGCNTTGNTIYVIDFSAGTVGASVAFDGTTPSGVQVNDISVHPNGEYMIVVYNASTWIATYQLPNKVRNYLKII